MTEGQDRTTPNLLDERAIRSRVARAVTRARLALTWESFWPLVVPALLVLGVYLIVSWFGLWRILPDPVRIGGLVLFALAGIAAILLPIRTRIANAAAGLSRVERVTGLPHRPATVANDRLVNAPTDPTARALWEAHRRRILAGLGNLRAGWPSPGVAKRDPYALRFLVLLLVVVAFIYSGPDRQSRLTEGLTPPVEAVPQVLARIDAWATPPTYTGRPPIFLTGDTGRPSGSVLEMPESTIVTVRVAGGSGISVFQTTAAGASEVLPAGAEAGAVPVPAREGDAPQPSEFHVTLTEPVTIAVRQDGADQLWWQFNVVADQPPQIALNAAPTVNQSGTITFSYTVRDDYGVVGAQADFAPLADLEAEAEDRPLVTAPSFPLSLPQMRAREGSAETIQDLLSHPWAGGKVTITLTARDESGQEGKSEPFEMTLPTQVFTRPLARALVEQRRILAFDANDAPPVAQALDALTIAPERFIPQSDAYLGIRAAYYRTINAHDDDVLRSVLDLLWEIAIGLDDSSVDEARQNLRDAAEELRQALENGASDEEIQRLTEQLRQAMQEFMQAMAEEAARQAQDPQQAQQQQPGQQGQEMTPQDLEEMLDQIQQLAQLGARDAAREMLNQLQNMMENLQIGQQQQGQQGQQGENPMADALEQLGEMIQQQQQLMDQTFQLQQEQNRREQGGEPEPGQQGEPQQGQQGQQQQQGQPGGENAPAMDGQQNQMPGGQPGQQEQGQGQGQGPNVGAGGRYGTMSNEQLADALQQLQQGQQRLQQQLQDLQQQLQDQGMAPGEQLGQAEEFMGDAEDALRQGQPNQAVEPQGQALQALRDTAQSFAQQLAEQIPQGQAQNGEQPQGNPPEDPLGRPQANSGLDPGSRVEVPDEIDIQRAREILETIRRRLGETFRPLPELDYLERLLEQY